MVIHRGPLHMGWRFLALVWLLQLAACSQLPPAAQQVAADVPAPPAAQRPAGGGASAFADWRHMPLPGKQATVYTPVRLDGREAVGVRAESSVSMLRQTLRIEPQDLGRVAFSWKVPALIAQADLGQREADDSPVRVVLAFEGDRSSLSLKDGMLSELAHALTGEPMPYATLMYVWCNTRAAESVVHSPRTGRIRKLVMESGHQNLNQWRDYERDIRADFIKAFGEAPGALVGIGIMTDTDNTRSSARAWYGPVQLGSSVVAKK